MKFKFDFSVDAWIQNVEIDAATEEEAKAKLINMDLADLVDEGYVKDFTVDDVDTEIIERDIVAKCYDISYDPEDVNEFIVFSAGDPPSEVTLTVEYVGKDDDVEDLLSSELDSLIYDKYGIFPTGFKFDIIEEK